MRRPRRFVMTVAGATAIVATLLPGGSANGSTAATPFVTAARPFLVPLANGVTVQPVLTTGDVIGTGKHAYQMSGVPDGIGWYESGPGEIGRAHV